jgi:hypothetical protein
MVVVFDLGERRIRVLTLSLPVTTSIGEVYSAADHHAIASLLVKKGSLVSS